jgi:ABC-type transport system involved in multi-copper enzyme maturation permease subunit
MSSKADTDRFDEPEAVAWRPAPELAPSTMAAEQPSMARMIGVISLFMAILGAVAWIANANESNTLIVRWISQGWAIFIVVVGLGGLLFHAATDSDLQVRRSYMWLGFGWLGLAAIVSVWKVEGEIGRLFVPYGFLGFFVGLLFLMSFLRQETEDKWRDAVVNAIGALGVILALTGFIGSNVSFAFLSPDGLFLLLLGLVFWWAYAGFKGTGNDLGYYAALGMGAAGLIGFLTALGRSVVPALTSGQSAATQGSSYFMTAGGLLMVFSVLYLAISLGLWSNNRLVVLTRRELAGIFYSPIAYIVLFGFAVIAWQVFADFVAGNGGERGPLWQSDPDMGRLGPTRQLEPIVVGYLRGIFPIISVIFVVPVLTMRLLSEEHRMGTLEVMLTAPLDETAVVLSKFISAFFVYLLVWLPWGLNFVALRAEGKTAFDYGPVLSSFIAVAVSGAGFISMGLFFSSLTRNQVTAAILTFVGMLTLTFCYVLKFNWKIGDWRRVVLEHINYIDLWFQADAGKLAARDLMAHLSAAVLWLFLTVKVLESRKWR